MWERKCDCEFCNKIPVLSDDDLTDYENGQSVGSLVQGIINKVENAAFGIKQAEENLDALSSMKNAMDNLEALFGFDAETKSIEEDTIENVREIDKTDRNGFYEVFRYSFKNYLATKAGKIEIKYCPVCGNELK